MHASDAVAIKAAIDYFGITPAGNFEDHGRPTFKTVLHESRPPRAVAAKLDISADEVESALARAKKAMFEAREARPKPFRDEKILTSWSSLMIGAMAEAGAALGEPGMIASAERALAFIEAKLVVRDGDGRVRASRLAKKVHETPVDGTSGSGEGGTNAGVWIVRSPGFLDDHAYLANAALDLYEATGDPAKVRLAQGWPTR